MNRPCLNLTHVLTRHVHHRSYILQRSPAEISNIQSARMLELPHFPFCKRQTNVLGRSAFPAVRIHLNPEMVPARYEWARPLLIDSTLKAVGSRLGPLDIRWIRLTIHEETQAQPLVRQPTEAFKTHPIPIPGNSGAQQAESDTPPFFVTSPCRLSSYDPISPS
jgi:hypothetical protein